MAGGLGEAASIAGLISLAGQTMQAITTIAAFCKAYNNVHTDIVKSATNLELLRRVLLQIETTANFSLAPSRCPPALISHLRDCVSACRQDMHSWLEWTKSIDISKARRLEKIWKKIRVAADQNHFSRLSNGVSAHIENITLCFQLLNCDLDVRTLTKAEHLNMSVKKLQVSQDDFRDEVLREISQVNDEMQQLKLSNCQKIDSLPIRMNSNAATNNTSSDLARQYQEILEHIQTEFRCQFLEIKGQLDEFQKFIQQRQIIIQGGHLNTDRRVTEAQLREALTLIEAELRVDHAYSFRRHKFGKSRRQQDFAPMETHISNPHQLQEWASSERSSLVMIQGAYSERFAIRGLCVDLILTLQTKEIPTIWALKSPRLSETSMTLSTTDILRSLLCQALYLNMNLRSERLVSSISAAAQETANPDAMFDILASTLDGITRVYLIIDIDSLSLFSEKIAWPSSILTMFRKLADHGSQSNVKVMLVSYTANTFLKVSDPEICERVIRAEARAGGIRTRLCLNSRKTLRNVDIAQRRSLSRDLQARKLRLRDDT